MLNRTAITLDWHRHGVRTAWITILGFLIGFFSAKWRPHAVNNGVHYEAIAEFFIAIPLICLVVLYILLRVQLKQAVQALVVSFSAFYFANAVGHVIGSIGEDHLFGFVGVCFTFWLASCVIGAALLAAVGWLWPLRHATTDCLKCGYSLKGLLEAACPECGRAFTLQEQGIEEKDLWVG